MCGIAGLIGHHDERHKSTLMRMVQFLRHRGPDASDTLWFDGCGLGHTRLSIVDLEGGQQPMASADRRLAITFNGEIYGYREIRKRLAGYRFQTSSDTEVLLALYEKHGPQMLPHVSGMFSFAIWDEARQRLFAARDRFGEKPFYYAFGKGGEFVFASEIKSILASGLIDPVVSRGSLAHYLQYLYVHPGRTIYENVFALPPAHALKFERGKLSVERYWTAPEPEDSIEFPDAVSEFRRLFNQAVERQLVADVPVGAFLSGGLDSTTVVASAVNRSPRLTTLSYAFDGDYSEAPFSRAVAQQFGTNHVEMSEDELDIPGLLHRMQEVYDEPFADSSNIPMYLLSRRAAREFKVVLTGDGADELLGGYRDAYAPFVWMNGDGDPNAATYALLRCLNSVTGRLGSVVPRSVKARLKGALYTSRYHTAAEAHRRQRQYFTDEEIVRFGLPCMSDMPGPGRGKPVEQVMTLDCENYLPGDILVKTDRASMAHGLELRAPFLDVEFASFCLSLPSRLKIDKRRDKIILRRSFESQWPECVRQRSKQGFGAPVRQWLSRPGMAKLRRHYLDDSNRTIYEWLPFESCRRIASSGDYRTWILLVLSLWFESRRDNVVPAEVTVPNRRISADDQRVASEGVSV